MQQVCPGEDRSQFAGQITDRFQAEVEPAAGVRQRHDVIALENTARDAAKLGGLGRVPAVEFIDAQAELAAVAGRRQFAQHALQLDSIVIPDAVAHNLVEAKPQFGSTAAQRKQKFWIEKRLAAGEAKDGNALSVCVFQEALGRSDVETIWPFDRHAAMRTGKIALIRPRERQIIGTKSTRTAADRADVAARIGRNG